MQTLNINLFKANAILSNVEDQTMVSKCLLLENDEFMETFTNAVNNIKDMNQITATLVNFVNNNY